MTLLAFDMGGTAVKYALVEQDGTILSKGKFKTPETLDALINQLQTTKRTYSTHPLTGIAFSCPGAVDNESGIIGGASAIPYIHHFPFRQLLEENLELPIALENDANCAALAETWLGVAKQASDILFLIIGTGIGGAVIKNGKIHAGAHLHGGEFGYMIMNDKLENLSDTGTAVNAASRIAKRKGLPSLSGIEAFQLKEAGDPIAMEEIDFMFRNLAKGIFNLQYVYDPELIVIGGGVSERPDFLSAIQTQLDDLLAQITIAKVAPTLVSCEFGNDANLIGAVANFNQIYD
ncbi:N-acetylmannosamine kinase [Listeria newyorkensis]|uniref:N-acetylmannosamine kinase n=1 Tax=Listeria newyorkensis TaxID=1497681 RepID=A0ABX4XN14_9LIST|nr:MULTISPECIES: ROK family protein [Listeria]KGL39480.1 N-acetylmannosamine kinase [Listeriaceae bacterium FSL A5-0209]KGL44247.1 N-acetylmannosamine kinase [Listeria newyorkensis]PNP93032.1 N-acetylmannosamine kinase [Listeria newyorkensis]RQW67028.1 ROK family protein [Listeria sp. SHR_NRA_18]WAO21657.1 ROK family protein [Listeria newyorkensis]